MEESLAFSARRVEVLCGNSLVTATILHGESWRGSLVSARLVGDLGRFPR